MSVRGRRRVTARRSESRTCPGGCERSVRLREGGGVDYFTFRSLSLAVLALDVAVAVVLFLFAPRKPRGED